MRYEESWKYVPPSLTERIQREFKRKVKDWKTRIIKKLGGYTYDEIHQQVVRASEGELKFAWVCQNKGMKGEDFRTCDKYVRTHRDYYVHDHFERFQGYRGNYPKGVGQ